MLQQCTTSDEVDKVWNQSNVAYMVHCHILVLYFQLNPLVIQLTRLPTTISSESLEQVPSESRNLSKITVGYGERKNLNKKLN